MKLHKSLETTVLAAHAGGCFKKEKALRERLSSMEGNFQHYCNCPRGVLWTNHPLVIGSVASGLVSCDLLRARYPIVPENVQVGGSLVLRVKTTTPAVIV